MRNVLIKLRNPEENPDPFSQALSDADRQAIESYLQLKYFGPIGVPGDFDGDGELTVSDIDLLTAASARAKCGPRRAGTVRRSAAGVGNDLRRGARKTQTVVL